MWTFIIIVILVVILKFAYDKFKQSEKITKEGGMLVKYRTLINYLKQDESNLQILKLTSDSVGFGASSIGGYTSFYLTATFGTLTIQWKSDGPIFGLHKMEWKFDEYLDQYLMWQKITNDLIRYQQNVMTAKGLIDDNY